MNPVTDWTEPDLPERQGPAAFLISGLSGLNGISGDFGTGGAAIPAKAIVDKNGVVIVDKNGVDIVSI